MRFTSAIVAAAALAPVLAQTPGFDPITAPTADQTLPAGSSFDITWTPSADEGTVKIVLIQGESPTTLQQGPTVASGIQNSAGKFTWTVPGNDFNTYGFNISLDNSDKFQLSNPFHISGDASSSSSSSASSTATISSSTSSVTSATLPTSTAVNSTSVTSTVCKKCEYNATSVPVPTGNSTASTSAIYTTPVVLPTGSGSNSTILTTVATPTPTGPSTGGSSPSATPPPATASSSAAVAKAATGGLAAIGGLVLAFVL
ncbi:Ser-Thr-rich glycosyl-phosphatidyl-inositol-anchored membrane family-domain-containing protein [Amylocarpus encephaloides]|uniref:Ser-Thr-rich glycosyl-phosphatidyl-inositol-anchored membrane family-domain-containing protein n=1 Tax=Amylocarpus encephaloides TaxID=45428 RepID=A0A9P7YSI1_9HELO|nr:Ser-Thr-rich glycosyl-phosphatidyl-inositol-anchored membrane family-domain-containing protein [Amylocarpus encephaloides]